MSASRIHRRSDRPLTDSTGSVFRRLFDVVKTKLRRRANAQSCANDNAKTMVVNAHEEIYRRACKEGIIIPESRIPIPTIEPSERHNSTRGRLECAFTHSNDSRDIILCDPPTIGFGPLNSHPVHSTQSKQFMRVSYRPISPPPVRLCRSSFCMYTAQGVCRECPGAWVLDLRLTGAEHFEQR